MGFDSKLHEDGNGGSRLDQIKSSSTTTMEFALKLHDDGNGGSRSDQIESSSTPTMGFAPKLLDEGDNDSRPTQKFAPKFFDESDDGSRPNFSATIANKAYADDDAVRKRISACLWQPEAWLQQSRMKMQRYRFKAENVRKY